MPAFPNSLRKRMPLLFHLECPPRDAPADLGGLVRKREVRFLVQLGLGYVDRPLAKIFHRPKLLRLDPKPGAQLLDAHTERLQVLLGFAHLVPANGVAALQGLYAQTLENSVKLDFRLPQSGAALVC
jgi:hypothetical protein